MKDELVIIDADGHAVERLPPQYRQCTSIYPNDKFDPLQTEAGGEAVADGGANTLEWASESASKHRAELIGDWDLCSACRHQRRSRR